MVCPNCGSGDIEMVNKKTAPHYENEEYVCLECECEWNWTMQREITKQGKDPYDDNEVASHPKPLEVASSQ